MTTISGFLDPDVDEYTEVSSYSTTSSYADAASVTLSIPSHWGGWKCEAFASYKHFGTTGASIDLKFVIDGTSAQAKTGITTVGDVLEGALVGGRTGISTTGSRSVSLQAQNNGTSVSLADINMWARAIRTA